MRSLTQQIGADLDFTSSRLGATCRLVRHPEKVTNTSRHAQLAHTHRQGNALGNLFAFAGRQTTIDDQTAVLAYART
jgi:hypothetical protein